MIINPKIIKGIKKNDIVTRFKLELDICNLVFYIEKTKRTRQKNINDLVLTKPQSFLSAHSHL